MEELAELVQIQKVKIPNYENATNNTTHCISNFDFLRGHARNQNADEEDRASGN